MDTSKLLLGTDPEIVFLGKDGLLSARDDCGFPRQGGHNGQNPEIGADGHPHIAEMRPPPASSPVDLTNNIKDILERNWKKVPEEAIWKAGSWVAEKPIGGHIHFGNITNNDASLIEYLDGIMAQTVILLEDSMEARKRRAGAYGKLSDVRTKAWGFEYRTLPSFILSPPITIGVLALAKAAALEHLTSGTVSLSKLKSSIIKSITKIDQIKFVNADRSYFSERFELIWLNVIKHFRYWHTDEGKLLWKNAALLRHIANNHPNWHNERDLLQRWGIRNKTREGYNEKKIGVLLDEPQAPEIAYERVFRNVRRLM